MNALIQSVRLIAVNARFAKTVFLAIAGIFLGASVSTFAEGPNTHANADAGVIPVNARFHGMTYGEWVTRWYQWLYEVALLPNSPVLDQTGANFAVGQSGPVWFTTWAPPVTVRSVTLPLGTALLVMDMSWDSLFQLPADATPDEIEAQREFLAEYIPQHQANQVIEIDGVPIQDVSQYLTISPAFNVSLPQVNWFGTPAGEYGPDVAGGYFLLLAPLSVGQHTVHLTWDFVGDFFGHWDATYDVTVNPKGPSN